jgi:5-methylcytosine-specific restriction endonuclease McrA
MTSCLLLNSTYEPLHIISLKRAVRLLVENKVEVIHDEAGRVRSEKISFRMPSVLRLLYYVKKAKNIIPLTKKNVLLRDDYKCQFCGYKGGKDMTVDHVTPKSKGGGSSWANLVAACQPCNTRKRDRTPQEAGMPLRRQPKVPHSIPWIVVSRNTCPDEWGKYITTYNVGIEERVQ